MAMTDECRFITGFLGCDCEIFENEKTDERIIERFNELMEQGKQEGFFPLMIVGTDDVLAEALELALEDAGLENTPEGIAALREGILREAEQIDAQAFLEGRLAELLALYADEDEQDDGPVDIWGEFRDYEPDVTLQSHMDGDKPAPELIIAKIPAKNPWELAAWVPMGGFNDCPSPAQQTAVFKYWREKYGAVPAVVTHDVWEMGLTKPPMSDEDAVAAAKEQFAFCEDIVTQANEGWDSIRGLASTLKGSTTWFFWWD
jgi:hypothetical protein